MAIKPKDMKILWGRAGGRCSFPGCNIALSEDKETVTESFPLGEQAHIVGDKDTAPRGESILTQEERDSYPNLILLCPTHHTTIDKNEHDWPVEKLHLIKRDHELRIERAITLDGAGDEVETPSACQDHIELAVRLCSLDCWIHIVAGLAKHRPQMQEDYYYALDEYAKRIGRAVFTDELKNLELPIRQLARTAHNLYETFRMHSFPMDDDYIKGTHFYKERIPGEWFHNPNYDEDVKEYSKWKIDLDRCVVDMTKAANWFADGVRKHFIAEFFVQSGKFVAHYDDIEPCEYTRAEKLHIIREIVGVKSEWVGRTK